MIFSFLVIFLVLQCAFLSFHFSVFLAIIQVKQCLCLIFHVIQFSFHFLGPKVCFSHIFFKIFSVSHRISHPTVCVSYFPWYSVFSPYSRLYSVHFSFCTFFIVSCHIPGRTGFVSHFSPFWVFLAIFHFLLYLFSFSMIFSFLVIFLVLQCAFLSFHFSVFLAIIQVKQCLCLIFHVFQFSFHYLGPTVCFSHIFSKFSVFLTAFHILQCVFLIFHDILFSCPIPGPTLCI